MSKMIKLISFLSILALLISACGLQNEPVAPPQNIGAPLPPPAEQYNSSLISHLELGKKGSGYTRTEVSGDCLWLVFSETGGSGAGSAEMQKMLNCDQEMRTSRAYTYGTIDGATYEIMNYGVDRAIKMKVYANIFSLFTSARKNLVDYSNLILVYEKSEEGYVLKDAQYQELWLGGKMDQDALAMGAFAKWDTNQIRKIMPAEYHKWGFWQNKPTMSDQSQMVVNSLGAAKAGLEKVPPAFLSADQDSIVELIGRQSGMKLYRNGTPVGDVTMDYGNWLNGLTGPESLSRINLNLGAKQCQVIVMKSAFSPVDSWVYIFTCDAEFGKKVMALDPKQWPILYAGLAADQYPVIVAIHVTGQPDPLMVDFSYEQKSDSLTTTKTSSAKFGTTGGRLFSTFADYKPERLYAASQMLALMGKGGITALNLSFPTIGSGLNYYLLSEVVAKNSADTKLGSLSRIDLVGDLDLVWYAEFVGSK